MHVTLKNKKNIGLVCFMSVSSSYFWLLCRTGMTWWPKKETFLIMVTTSFTLWEKWCSHTVQPKYEDISTIFVDFMNILTNFGRTMNFCAISTPQGAGSTTPYCWPCIVTTCILATPFYVPHLTLILEMKYNISTWIAFHSVDNESESFWSNLNAFIC